MIPERTHEMGRTGRFPERGLPRPEQTRARRCRRHHLAPELPPCRPHPTPAPSITARIDRASHSPSTVHSGALSPSTDTPSPHPGPGCSPSPESLFAFGRNRRSPSAGISVRLRRNTQHCVFPRRWIWGGIYIRDLRGRRSQNLARCGVGAVCPLRRRLRFQLRLSAHSHRRGPESPAETRLLLLSRHSSLQGHLNQNRVQS